MRIRLLGLLVRYVVIL